MKMKTTGNSKLTLLMPDSLEEEGPGGPINGKSSPSEDFHE